MIILSKKKILICNIIFVFVFLIYNFSLKKDYVPTSSIPSANHTIVIDAGHGTPDGGAVASDGTTESEINLKVALKLQNLLESSNCTVILTRSDENGIYEGDCKSIREKKVSDMKNRVKIGNLSDAEIFVSIHMNKLPQTQYSGWQTFYKNTDENSKKLAEYIQNNLNYFIDKNNNREIKSINNIYLTKNIEIPLVIVECGFLSNINESKSLQKDEYQNLLAWSIYSGIQDYFQ